MSRGSAFSSRSSSRSSRLLLAVAALLVACLLLISIAPCDAMSKKEARAAKKAATKAAAAAASSTSSSAASDQTVAEDKPPAGEVLVRQRRRWKGRRSREEIAEIQLFVERFSSEETKKTQPLPTKMSTSFRSPAARRSSSSTPTRAASCTRRTSVSFNLFCSPFLNPFF